MYSSKGEITGFREASFEVSKNASQTSSTTDLNMFHQGAFAELISTQKDLPANMELPTKTGGIRSGNCRTVIGHKIKQKLMMKTEKKSRTYFEQK